MSLGLRLLVSPLLRLTRPGMTACLHCGWPWSYAKPHLYYYEPNQAIFFCCEWCWPQTRRLTRFTYGTLVVRGWGVGWRHNEPWDEEKAEKVIDALLRDESV